MDAAGGEHRSRPRALALELTKGCNLRCGYCYYAQRDDAYDPRTRMTAEVARRSVDLLFEEGPAHEPVRLHFFGGEPLLDFPLLARTVRHAERRAREESREVVFEVTTNGTRLTEEVVAFLNEHDVLVGVSFDGPPEVQDAARPALGGSSAALALPGIRRLLESRRGTPLQGSTHCSVVVTRRCLDLVGIVEYLEGLGFQKIILTPATDLSGESHGFREADLPDVLAAYDELAEAWERAVREGRPVAAVWFPSLLERVLSGERKAHFCDGGRDYLGVAADGAIHLCYRFFEDDRFRMGSVTEGIDRGVTERLDAHPLDARTACSVCWARHYCGGGCHHENVTVGGGLGEPNPVTCEIFRRSMDRTLEAWGRLSREGRLPRREATPDAGQTATMTETEDPAPYTDDDRPKASPSAHARELEGEKVVYDPATHEVVVLNSTAALIFELCDGRRRVAELLQELKERFDAPEDVLRRDLRTTLTELHAKRLVS